MSTAEQKMSRALAVMLGSLAVFVIAMVVILVLSIKAAFARDLGQWKDADPELRAWYQSLKQPDVPAISCCGEADSYWCDEGARGQQVICTINDNRDDAALMRKHVPNGTVIEIPQHKINKDPNPTGHAVVFLSMAGYVWCFVGISGS